MLSFLNSAGELLGTATVSTSAKNIDTDLCVPGSRMIEPEFLKRKKKEKRIAHFLCLN